jgi:chromosomal replication initiator protein
LFLSEDIFYYIAREIKNSVRELEGALMRLSAYAEVMKMELDLKTAITLLQLNKQINSDAVSLEKIASQVSNYLHVPQPDLLGRSRQKEIVHARHIAMFLAQNLTNKTLNDIGIFFGGRDHTSVLHGVKKIDALISSNQEVSRAIEQIKSNLT